MGGPELKKSDQIKIGRWTRGKKNRKSFFHLKVVKGGVKKNVKAKKKGKKLDQILRTTNKRISYRIT